MCVFFLIWCDHVTGTNCLNAIFLDSGAKSVNLEVQHFLFTGVSRILGKRERKREAGTARGTGTTDGKCLKKDIMLIY